MSAQKEQHKYNPLLTYVTGAYIVDSLFKKLVLGLGSYKKKIFNRRKFHFQLIYSDNIPLFTSPITQTPKSKYIISCISGILSSIPCTGALGSPSTLLLARQPPSLHPRLWISRFPHYSFPFLSVFVLWEEAGSVLGIC